MSLSCVLLLLQGVVPAELGRRASVYGYPGVSAGSTMAAGAAFLHDDAGRRASMYAAVDVAAAAGPHPGDVAGLHHGGDAAAAVGMPGMWATSAELRCAQVTLLLTRCGIQTQSKRQRWELHLCTTSKLLP